MRKIFIATFFILLFTTSCREQKSLPLEHLYIVATNDIHANIYAMPQLATLVKEYESRGDVLVVDSGDRVSGNAFVDDGARPGVAIIELMNAIGYDVVTVGNHEFDKGPAVLGDMVRTAEFKTVCSNALSLTGEVPFESVVSFEFGELKVAFVGVVDTDDGGHPLGQEQVYEEFRFTNDVQSAYDVCASLEDDVDFVVVLSHMGDNIDEQFIALNPRCDWVAGGHTHEMRNRTINGIQLTQSGKNLGSVMLAHISHRDGEVVDVEYDTIALDRWIADSQLTELVAQIKSRNPELNAVEGYANEHITRDGVANLTVAALKEYPYAGGLTPDIAFYHYGGIRLSSILKGAITRGDIYNNDPFNSYILLGEMTTEQIRTFILDKYNAVGEGGRADKESHYPYFRANIPYEIVVGEDGDASDINIGLTPGQSYSVAICDYIAKKYIDEAIVREQFREAGVTVREALLEYVRTATEGITPDNVNHQVELR